MGDRTASLRAEERAGRCLLFIWKSIGNIENDISYIIKEKPRKAARFFGATGRIRTGDLLMTNYEIRFSQLFTVCNKP